MVAVTRSKRKGQLTGSLGFLDLPIELRTMILNYLLIHSPESDIQIAYYRDDSGQGSSSEGSPSRSSYHRLVPHTTLSPPPDSVKSTYAQSAILLTCRTLYIEASPILYSKNTFVFRDLNHLRITFLANLRPATALLLRSIRFYDAKYGPFRVRGRSIDRLYDPAKQLTPPQWWSLRNVEHVDSVYSWEATMAFDPLVGEGPVRTANFPPGPRYSGIRNEFYKNRFECVCAGLEGEMTSVVAGLRWARSVTWEQAMQVSERGKQSKHDNLVVSYDVASALGTQAEEEYKLHMGEPSRYMVHAQRGGRGHPTPLDLPTVREACLDTLMARLRNLMTSYRRERKPTIELPLQRRLAQYIAEKSLIYLEYQETWGNLFVITLDPIWKG